MKTSAASRNETMHGDVGSLIELTRQGVFRMNGKKAGILDRGDVVLVLRVTTLKTGGELGMFRQVPVKVRVRMDAKESHMSAGTLMVLRDEIVGVSKSKVTIRTSVYAWESIGTSCKGDAVLAVKVDND